MTEKISKRRLRSIIKSQEHFEKWHKRQGRDPAAVRKRLCRVNYRTPHNPDMFDFDNRRCV